MSLPVRSNDGGVRVVSWFSPWPMWSLSTIAKPPSPPVRLPRLPGSSKVQPPVVPSALTTLQPSGAAAVEVKLASAHGVRGLVSVAGWRAAG